MDHPSLEQKLALNGDFSGILFATKGRVLLPSTLIDLFQKRKRVSLLRNGKFEMRPQIDLYMRVHSSFSPVDSPYGWVELTDKIPDHAAPFVFPEYFARPLDGKRISLQKQKGESQHPLPFTYPTSLSLIGCISYVAIVEESTKKEFTLGPNSFTRLGIPEAPRNQDYLSR